MGPAKGGVRAVIGLVCGLLSFTLLLPSWLSWLGLAAALSAVSLGRFGKAQTKTQEYLRLGGIVLALVAGVLYLALKILV